MAAMRNESHGDVWKVWLYAAASIVAGAWVSPWVFNAGKALAEVSSSKMTNGFLKWLADLCRAANFPMFYTASVILAALVFFLPWMECIHAPRGVETKGPGPWLLRLPHGARLATRGQRLRRYLGGPWDCCLGFMLVAGLLLSMGVVLKPAGLVTMNQAPEGLIRLMLRALIVTLPLAFLMETIFRGVMMGIFLRAMRPAAALGMTSAFFALVMCAFPPVDLQVADPDVGGTGFGLLKTTITQFADWKVICMSFAPLLGLGAVLSYARWRTASLWLPVGLHTGWLTAKMVLAKLSAPSAAGESAVIGNVLLQGLVPLVAVILAGLLAHRITFPAENDGYEAT